MGRFDGSRAVGIDGALETRALCAAPCRPPLHRPKSDTKTRAEREESLSNLPVSLSYLCGSVSLDPSLRFVSRRAQLVRELKSGSRPVHSFPQRSRGDFGAVSNEFGDLFHVDHVLGVLGACDSRFVLDDRSFQRTRAKCPVAFPAKRKDRTLPRPNENFNETISTQVSKCPRSARVPDRQLGQREGKGCFSRSRDARSKLGEKRESPLTASKCFIAPEKKPSTSGRPLPRLKVDARPKHARFFHSKEGGKRTPLVRPRRSPWCSGPLAAACSPRVSYVVLCSENSVVSRNDIRTLV